MVKRDNLHGGTTVRNWRQRRRGPFYMATLAALPCFAVMLVLVPHLAIESAAIVFYITYLALMAARIPGLTAARLRASPERDDEPARAILLVTLFTVVAAIAALFNALNRTHGQNLAEIALAFASVIGGWLTLHTMFAMHYAHRFWRHRPDETGAARPTGGLDFPGTQEPCGWDFLYFSFIIGMTAQTSDTGLTTTAMRRVNLAHAVVSFFFNTVLVAAAVNAVVSLAG
ncbi:DUF1345 domain-containing protein [Ensifer soli]|uniref:DUF1345 domain-containing protein n=1 Tax=Ciceribacter sp. sgz301302 TaxID=3342379 RepID=UPI0035B6F680